MSPRAAVVNDAASGSRALVEAFAFEAQPSRPQAAAADEGVRKAWPASEPCAPATLQEAARGLMNV